MEEQTGELETLRCIYTDQEFTEVSDSPPCFQIHVEPADIADEDDCTGSLGYIIVDPTIY